MCTPLEHQAHFGQTAVGFDANHHKGRGDDNHWLGPPPPPRGASKHQEIDLGDLWDRNLLLCFEPGNANFKFLFDAYAISAVSGRFETSFIIRTLCCEKTCFAAEL